MTVRTIVIRNINNCPLLILMPDHWVDEYACRCGQEDYPEMAERGYVWSEDQGRWTLPR